MPVEMTVFRWIRSYPEFAQMYAQACAARTMAWAEEIVEIADGTGTMTQLPSSVIGLGSTRKWLMAKCMPKK